MRDCLWWFSAIGFLAGVAIVTSAVTKAIGMPELPGTILTYAVTGLVGFVIGYFDGPPSDFE